MIKPQNQICSDCPERQPRWASLIVPPPGSPPGSLAFGAFCCLECSGSHRRLGVHISFVRSITLDSWKEKEVLAMENGGNAKVNAIFEANLHNTTIKPTVGASGPVRERFIRDKYERRKYYDPNVLQNYKDISAPETAGRNTRSTTTPSRRAPSDAARTRAQARRTTAVPRIHTLPSSAPPPPPPPPAQEVDLLDFNASPNDLSAPPNPPSAGPSPTLEMFKTMSMTRASGAGNGAGGVPRTQTAPSMGSTKMNLAPQMEGKLSSDDIMAMFHAPSPAQQNFGNFNNAGMNGNMNGNMNGMANNGMQGMPGGTMHVNNMLINQQQQMLRNNMMHNKSMMNNNATMSNSNMGMGMGTNQNNMTMNQNSNMMQQQNSFGGMQQNNMMGGQGMNQQNIRNNTGMGMNSFSTNTNNTMMQQQSQPMGGTPNNMNMMGGNGMNQGFQANNNIAGNSMNKQTSNQNFQGGMGGNNNGNNGNMGGYDTSSVMGGTGNTQQHQFASFGSFH